MESGNSCTETADSSPKYSDTAVTLDETPHPAAVRVKFMCSYGGRIQPRHNDNQLSYFGGETKILAVERSIRFLAIKAKLASLCGANAIDEIFFKYQLPGEDLDALISVTNDEDLDHMMIEYDRLLTSSRKIGRFRLFLFLANPSFRSQRSEEKADRTWFFKTQLLPQSEQSIDYDPLFPPPPPSSVQSMDRDSLFPPPFPPPPPAIIPDLLSGTMGVHSGRHAPTKDEALQTAHEVVVSSSVQKQIQEIQNLQISEKQPYLLADMQQNASNESSARVYQEEPYASALGTQIPTAYWGDQFGITNGRLASVAGGDSTVYLIPASHNLYSMAAGQTYYTSAHPPPAFSRAVPTDIYRDVPMYAVPAPPSGMDVAPANSLGTGYTATQVAFDGTGRPVFYPGSAVPAYQAVALNTDPVMKPSQIS